jgi:hypothetical protein
MARDKREKGLTGEGISDEVAALEWMTAMMQMLPVTAVWTMRRSWTREC